MDYKGLLDEIRFWSRAKSAPEISSDYASPVTGVEAELVGHYHFDEGSGSSACSSISGNDCLAFANMANGFWSSENAPLGPSTPGELPVPAGFAVD